MSYTAVLIHFSFIHDKKNRNFYAQTATRTAHLHQTFIENDL